MNSTNVTPVSIAVFLLMAVCLVVHVIPASAQSTLRVQVGPVIIDVCPNILGVQDNIPPGMEINATGDCITPPPVIADACANIDGLQTTIPAGYYQNSSGSCFPQPDPPVDVCPNIFGMQSIVPSGLNVDVTGRCITPPADECPNISGPQPTIPLGMISVDGVCFTPLPSTTDNDLPSSENSTQSHGGLIPALREYKNVSAALTPVIEPFVNLVPESVKQIVKSVPRSVARTVPYYIFGMLALVSLILATQSLQELTAMRRLMLVRKREKDIAEQKDNFITLASHYLRTPLTLMRNGIDTVTALKEVKPVKITPLRDTIHSMEEDIRSILERIDNNEILKHIKAPEHTSKTPSIIRSPFLWGPIIGSTVIALLANFLLGVVADVDLGTANLFFQTVVILAVSMLFYTAIRNFYLHRQRRQHQQNLLQHEHAVDVARNSFIEQSTTVLSRGLTRVYNNRHLLGSAPSARFFDEGYIRFNTMLEKFILLSHIKGLHEYDTEPLQLAHTVDGILQSYNDRAADQRITIVNDINRGIVTKQNRTLFEFIIRSVIDNAIKFNVPNGTIHISADTSTKQLILSIRDSGIGISKDELSQLFQPFSRTNSALQFNYEGLGFSLFLDKIIADYIGSSIAATSSTEHGTNITLRSSLS